MNFIRKYKLYKLFDESDLKEFFQEFENFINNLEIEFQNTNNFYVDKSHIIFVYAKDINVLYIHNNDIIFDIFIKFNLLNYNKININKFLIFYIKTYLISDIYEIIIL